MFTVERYPNLKSLSLSETTCITDAGFSSLLSHSPLLEDISLVDCHQLEKINIASRYLKRFSLDSCICGPTEYIQRLCKNKEVIIDAPNLISLEYHHHYLSNLSILSSPLEQAELSFRLSYDTSEVLDAEWFCMLGALFKRFKSSSSLQLPGGLGLSSEKCVGTKEFVAIAPSNAYEIEELNLYWCDPIPVPFQVFVDGLFSVCRPKTILFSRNSYQDEFLQYLCKELLHTRGHNGRVSCWSIYLEDAALEILSEKQGKWIQIGRKRFLAASRKLEPHTEIRFTLRWCVAGEN